MPLNAPESKVANHSTDSVDERRCATVAGYDRVHGFSRLSAHPGERWRTKKPLISGAEMGGANVDELQRTLLDVLDLLAHLFDQHLQLHGRLGAAAINRLAAQRVRLAIEFLHEEIQPASDRFVQG